MLPGFDHEEQTQEDQITQDDQIIQDDQITQEDKRKNVEQSSPQFSKVTFPLRTKSPGDSIAKHRISSTLEARHRPR